MKTNLPNHKGAWHPFQSWECFKAGMYLIGKRPEAIDSAASILGVYERCLEAMVAVVNDWRISSEHHLTKEWTNRNAWLGQAACCYMAGVNEEETREAWCQVLSEQQRIVANAIADMVIELWVCEENVNDLLQLEFDYA